MRISPKIQRSFAQIAIAKAKVAAVEELQKARGAKDSPKLIGVEAALLAEDPYARALVLAKTFSKAK